MSIYVDKSRAIFGGLLPALRGFDCLDGFEGVVKNILAAPVQILGTAVSAYKPHSADPGGLGGVHIHARVTDHIYASCYIG